jgi:hypothetical protein
MHHDTITAPNTVELTTEEIAAQPVLSEPTDLEGNPLPPEDAATHGTAQTRWRAGAVDFKTRHFPNAGSFLTITATFLGDPHRGPALRPFASAVDEPLLAAARAAYHASEHRQRLDRLREQHTDAVAREDAAGKRIKSAAARRQVATLDLPTDWPTTVRACDAEIGEATRDRDAAAADIETITPLVKAEEQAVEQEIRDTITEAIPGVWDALLQRAGRLQHRLAEVANEVLEEITATRLAMTLTQEREDLANSLVRRTMQAGPKAADGSGPAEAPATDGTSSTGWVSGVVKPAADGRPAEIVPMESVAVPGATIPVPVTVPCQEDDDQQQEEPERVQIGLQTPEVEPPTKIGLQPVRRTSPKGRAAARADTNG